VGIQSPQKMVISWDFKRILFILWDSMGLYGIFNGIFFLDLNGDL
jgi:hypothetical protein